MDSENSTYAIFSSKSNSMDLVSDQIDDSDGPLSNTIS